MNNAPKVIVGYKSGLLTVIAFSHKSLSYQNYWLCKCECGKEKIVPQTCLNRKSGSRTKSCGCKKYGHNKGKYIAKNPGFRPSAWRVYRCNYKDADISFEDFVKMSQQPCYYCGALKSNKFNSYITKKGEKRSGNRVTDKRISETWFEYNGLDRIDSNLPHTKENCVTSCGTCNKMKQILTPKEFITHCRKITEYVRRK